MREIGLAVLAVCMLIFTSASIGHAQSAEDLARGQSAGLRYTRSDSDVCSRFRETVDIRGDEITWGRIIDWAKDTACWPHDRVGVWRSFGMLKITNKYTDGNKLVLESSGNFTQRFIIDGHKASDCRKDPQGWKCIEGYTRQQ